MSLPYIPQVYAHAKNGQIAFGGINHNLYAGDGEIFDMRNLTSDYFPLLSPRGKRYDAYTVTNPLGIHANDGLYWVDDGKLYINGTEVEDPYGFNKTPKTIVSIGNYVTVWPDAKAYDKTTQKIVSLKRANTFESVEVANGTYAGEKAEANTIDTKLPNVSNMFRPGDAVFFTGIDEYLSDPAAALIIREIDDSKLVFYENTFIKTGTATNVIISRSIPEMDFICENENRLWGCKGDTIYASKLGDPFNWNAFDGISTDSYAAEVGSAGSFTACCSYLGYPVFFKEDHIYKVYGDRPSNYQVMSSASLGVEAGSSKSLAIAGEILFYNSRAGIMAYSGGIPQLVSAPLGTERYKNAVAGSDGIKYYVSMQNRNNDWHLYVYDTRYQLWHKEDNTCAYGFAWDGELFMLTANTIWVCGNTRRNYNEAEDQVQSFAEFGDFIESSPNAKYVSKFQLRAELYAGCTLTVKIQYDSGEWEEIERLRCEKLFGKDEKQSYIIPVKPRRADHYRLRIEGEGDYKIYSLTRVYDNSSELRTK